MKRLTLVLSLILLTSCLLNKDDNSAVAPVMKSPATDIPSGVYKLDPTHASIVFKVDHLGISQYTARFTRFDASLELDAANPQNSRVTAEIDPASLETDYPKGGFDFNAVLQGEKWFHVIKFPKITFRSKKIEITGAHTARIIGKLGMHGITKDVVLEAKFNGGYAKMPMGPSDARIGFSAHGVLKRSDFGISFGIPQEGSNMGVGDTVEFNIEAEFTRPQDSAK